MTNVNNTQFQFITPRTVMPVTSNVTVITVTYNSAAVISAHLDSLAANTPVVIVDNASDDATVALAARRSNVTVERLERNRGFGTACNVGARMAGTPHLLFLNPDARLEANTLTMLLAAVARYPERSVFNPRIHDDAGNLDLRAPSRFLGRARITHATRPDSDLPINVLTGAAIFIRRDHFEEIGGFDETLFLYFEDDDLSLRLIQQGFGLYHINSAIVHHHGGAASPPSPALTRFKNYHWMKSYRVVARKHNVAFNRPALLGLSGWRWLTAVATGNATERQKYEGRLKALAES